MRMKKLLIIAAAALLAAACAKTYEVKETTPPAIGFGTWTDVMTKARATGTGSFANGDEFEVYGTKTVSGAKSVVFHDVDVKFDGTNWDYSPHRFWDPAASQYEFYAVMPKDILAAEATTGDYAKTGLFTSTDITFGDPTANSNDILVADQKVCTPEGASAPYDYSAFQTGNKVQLSFNHVATGVDLFVKQDATLGDAVVKVTALSLLNISNKGHFTVSAYETNVPTVGWTPATSPTVLETVASSGEYKVLDASDASDDVIVSGKTTYNASHAATGTVGSAAPIFTGYVFMPQTLNSGAGAQKIKLSYTIQVGTEDPIEYNDFVFDISKFQTTDTDNNGGEDIAVWAPKTKYIYTMTIRAENVIEFTATVKEWGTTITEGYHYLVN